MASMKRLYDAKMKEILCEYVRNGETPMVVAERCDVSSSVLRSWCREREIKWVKPAGKYDGELVQSILVEIKYGRTTTAKASRKHGVSQTALQRACKKYGIKSRGRGKNLCTEFRPDNLEMQREMQIIVKISARIHGWKRSKALLKHIPEAQQKDYERLFLHGVIA